MSQPIENEFSEGQMLLLSSDEQNYAFDLWETFRIALGRHNSNDITLASRKVSNYHAEILNEGDGWLLRDLGSTNGTYVNDEKVHRQRLSDGDLVRIGGYVLKVQIKARQDGEGAGYGLLPVGSKGNLAPVLNEPTQPGTAPGRRDPSLVDLLRVLSRGSNSCALILRTPAGDEGQIFLEQGRVVHSELGKVRAEKALYRIFRWREGTYEVAPFPTASPVSHSIELPTDALVTEGRKHIDHVDKIGQVLPPPIIPMRLKEDCPLPLCELSPAEIEIFQSIIRHETIAKILESSAMTDLRILELIHGLFQKKVITVSEESGALLEETFILRSN
jgi:hypothetical protein